MSNPAWYQQQRQTMVSLIIREGIDLRRDDELIRRMMLNMEASDNWLHDYGLTNSSTSEERNETYHAMILADEGLLTPYGHQGLYRMTSQGHDWVAAVREEGIWTKTKEVTAGAAGISLKIIGSIAEEFIKERLRRLGVPLP